MPKENPEYGTKESIIESLSILKEKIDNAISYMNYKGTKGDLKNHLQDLRLIEFWSNSVIRQYIFFIEKYFTP